METVTGTFRMLTTQHSDLLWLAKCKIPVSICLAPVRHKGEVWYQMLIQPQGTEQGATLLNRNGAPRLWKNLSAAVRFVAKTLRHVETVTVQVQKKSQDSGAIKKKLRG